MSKVIYYIVFIYLVSFWLLFCFKTKTIIEIVAVFGKYLIQSLFLFNKPGKYDKNNNNNNNGSYSQNIFFKDLIFLSKCFI